MSHGLAGDSAGNYRSHFSNRIAFIIPLLFLLSGCGSTDNSPYERKQVQVKVPEQIRGKTPQKPEYVIRNGEKVPYDE